MLERDRSTLFISGSPFSSEHDLVSLLESLHSTAMMFWYIDLGLLIAISYSVTCEHFPISIHTCKNERGILQCPFPGEGKLNLCPDRSLESIRILSFERLTRDMRVEIIAQDAPDLRVIQVLDGNIPCSNLKYPVYTRLYINGKPCLSASQPTRHDHGPDDTKPNPPYSSPEASTCPTCTSSDANLNMSHSTSMEIMDRTITIISILSEMLRRLCTLMVLLIAIIRLMRTVHRRQQVGETRNHQLSDEHHNQPQRDSPTSSPRRRNPQAVSRPIDGVDQPQVLRRSTRTRRAPKKFTL